jgi:hypothetical protein
MDNNENSYHYFDPDFKYTGKNGLLHNLANIQNEKVLLAFESLKVTKRVEELLEHPIKIKDSNTLPPNCHPEWPTKEVVSKGVNWVL